MTSDKNIALLRPAGAPLRRELNLFDALSIVVGTVIGSGIFILPAFIALHLKCLGGVLLVWTVGGILTIFGALSLAELGSVYPGTGGLCTYLHHAYGPLTAFLYVWALLLMIHSGSIAALAAAFSLLGAQIVALSTLKMKLFSVIGIMILTGINCLGIRPGKLVQNFVAAAKVTALIAVIVLLNFKGSRPIHLPDGVAVTKSHFSLAGFGIALIAVLWAYEAWHIVSFVAGEMKRPQLVLPRSLLYGTIIVMLIFVTANLGYYHVLSAGEIRASTTVAATAVDRVLGPSGKIVISFLILVSILGSMNGMILSGPRVYYAMARQNMLPSVLGSVSARFRTPTVGLVIQGCWASALAASGTYEQLFTDVIFTAWIFYGLAVAAVLVLRRREPQLERPFRVPGYPWIPVLFCLAATGLILSTLIKRPRGALLGLGLVGTGVPVYCLGIKRTLASKQMRRI